MNKKDCIDSKTAVLERLKLLHGRGYKLSFLWASDADAVPGTNKISTHAKDAIKEYNTWIP